MVAEPKPAYAPVTPVNIQEAQAQITCSLDNPEGCEMCGS
jgi:hypothetical protein